MKILIFSVAYSPFIGGAEIAVKEITDRIPDAEFHLVTVNLDGRQKKEEKIGNVYVYRTGPASMLGKLLFPLVGVVKALSLQKNKKFDATWGIMANYAGFATLFFTYLNPKIPFILTLQEGDPIAYIKRHVWFVYPLFVQIFRKADRIQTISNYLADFAKSMKTRAPISVIPNGVDVSLFSQTHPPQALEELKNLLGKKPGDVFLVTTSRLVTKNAVDDVISALQFLPEHISFLVLGTGELENKLHARTKKLGLENRVIFLGAIPYTEIPKYLAISDIFIRPSISEGMGNSFIEAMAAQIPVIATRVGGIPDFIEDKKTGFFCEVKNPKSIAEKVNEILNNSALRQEVVENAYALVIKSYDWNVVVEKMRKEIFRL